MKLNQMAAARSSAGHRWSGFSSRLPAPFVSSQIGTRGATRPYFVSASPHATATDETERGEKAKKPSRRTTRVARPQDGEEADDSSHLAEGKQHATQNKVWRSAELGLGVVTRERCLLTAERSAEWVLGLDINTNSTGFTVLHAPTGEMAECGVIETKAIPDLFDKVTFLRRRLAAIHAAKKGDDKEATTWVVGIEDFLKSFGGAQWRTSDIMKLACLNSLVSYECWHLFFCHHQEHSPPTLEFGEADDEFALQHLPPENDDEANEDDEASYMTFGTRRPFKVHPSQARTYFGIRKRSAEDKIKDLGFHRVKNLFPSDHPWIIKKTGRLSEKNYDVVDSFMVAHYTRKMAVESALYSDPHLFAEFEAAWLLKNSAAVETLRPRHTNNHQPPADVDVVSKRAWRRPLVDERSLSASWSEALVCDPLDDVGRASERLIVLACIDAC